jgi:hypothetical protein
VIKPACSASFLLSINIFVWQNVLYFLNDLRIITLSHSEPLYCIYGITCNITFHDLHSHVLRFYIIDLITIFYDIHK